MKHKHGAGSAAQQQSDFVDCTRPWVQFPVPLKNMQAQSPLPDSPGTPKLLPLWVSIPPFLFLWGQGTQYFLCVQMGKETQ